MASPNGPSLDTVTDEADVVAQISCPPDDDINGLPDLCSQSDSDDDNDRNGLADIPSESATSVVEMHHFPKPPRYIQATAADHIVCQETGPTAEYCCDNCGVTKEKSNEDIFKRCSACFSTKYCSKLCQKKHWVKTHKHHCAKLTNTALFGIIFQRTDRAFEDSPVCSMATSSERAKNRPHVGHFQHAMPDAITAWMQRVGASMVHMKVLCKRLYKNYPRPSVKRICDIFLGLTREELWNDCILEDFMASNKMTLAKFLTALNSLKLPKNMPKLPTLTETLHTHLCKLSDETSTLHLDHVLFAQLVLIDAGKGATFVPGSFAVAIGKQEPWFMMERFSKDTDLKYGLFTLNEKAQWSELETITSYNCRWLIGPRKTDNRYLGLADKGPCYQTLDEWHAFLVHGIEKETQKDTFPRNKWKLFHFNDTGLDVKNVFR